MHTGEPTDIPPEHILANEIKAPTLLPSSFPRPLMPPHFSGPLPPHAGLFSPSFITDVTSSALNIPLSSPITTFAAPKTNLSPVLPTQQKPDKTSIDGTAECKRESISPSISNRSSCPSTPNSIKSEKAISETPNAPKILSPHPLALPAPPPPPDISPNPTITQLMATSSAQSSDELNSNFSTSLAALENHVKTINSSIPQPLPFGPFGLGLHHLSQFQRTESEQNIRLPQMSNNATDLSLHSKAKEKLSPNIRSFSPSSLTSKGTSDISADDRSTPSSPAKTERSSPPLTPSGGALDLTPKANNNSQPSAAQDNSQDMSLIPLPKTPNLDTRFFPPPFAGLPFPAGRPNTTCRICLKTFACYSALEIHYRSHTKERPFKCDFCDRGFSTKGNMKQHMLTHKIRDLPADLYTTTTSTNTPPTTTITNFSNTNPSSTNTITTTTSTSSNNSSGISNPPTPNGNSNSNEKHCSPAEQGSPSKLPARPPGTPKHVCHVCHKPFSSGSALQVNKSLIRKEFL